MAVNIHSPARAGLIRTVPVQFTASLDAGATNVSSNVGYWHRDGKFMVANGVIQYDGAGGDAAVWTLTIPNSETVDTAFLGSGANYNAADAMYVMDVQFYDASGGAWNFLSGMLSSSTKVKFVNSGGTTYTNDVFATGDGIKYWLRVPIVGWS